MPQPCDLQPLLCIQAQNSGTAAELVLKSSAGGLYFKDSTPGGLFTSSVSS